MLGRIEGVLGEGGVNAVLEGCADFAKGHAGAVKLALVADLARR